jgi:hypothetical protein
MVAFKEGTRFWSRYEDGKRPMTLAEIREAFTTDLLNRRLLAIQQGVEELHKGEAAQRRQAILTEIESGAAVARLNIAAGRELSEIDAERFVRQSRIDLPSTSRPLQILRVLAWSMLSNRSFDDSSPTHPDPDQPAGS